MAVKRVAVKPERDSSRYRRILGVDSSSTGIAWTLCVGNHQTGVEMMRQGKIDLTKQKEMNDKLKTIYIEWGNLLDELKPDHIFVEKSIFVKNPATARTLSYVVGTLMAIALGEGYGATDVEPATWKAFMGYTNLSSKFVASAKKALGDTEGKKFCDRLRKSQTWRVIQHNFPHQTEGTLAEHDHDIADSWGLALYGHDLLAAPLNLEKSKSIALDMEHLASLGLTL